MAANAWPPLGTAPLIDRHAERALVGDILEDVQPDPPVSVDDLANDFTDDGDRLLFLVAVELQNAGKLYTPSDYGSASECSRVKRANASLVAHEIDRLGDIWPNADSVRWELVQCIDASTLPMLCDWHCRRIHDASLRRQLINRAREIARVAVSPAPLDMQEVAKCLAT